MGGTFAQEDCFFGTLAMSRFVSNVETSFLSLTGKDLSDKHIKDRKQKQRDI